MPGAILSPIEPSGSPNLNAKARLQPNLRNLAAAAAGLSAESGSSDSCGACIGTPRALSTAGQVPFHAKGAAVSAALRPNADVSGLERETPPPLSQRSEPQHAHAQARGTAQRYGNSNVALPAIEPDIDMDRDELQRNSLRAAAAAAGGTGGAGPAAHVISGPMLQQLLAVRGMMCGPDGREAGGGDFGGTATDQPDGGNGAAAAAGGGGGRPRGGGGGLGPGNNPSPGMQVLHTHPKIEQYVNGGGGYGMSMAAQGVSAAAADGGSEGSDFGARRSGNGKRFPPADPDDSPRERGDPRAVGEAPPPGYELPPRAGVGGATAPSAPSLLALQQHAPYSSGAYGGGGGGAKAAAGVRGALTAAPRRGSAAAAVEAEGYDALGGGGDADDAADFAADGGGAGGALLPAELPGPVEVTVAVRVGSGRAAEEDARYGNGSYVKGHACGVFEPALYMSRMDCIRYQGTLISRSHFEKIGGSNMAKWYRSIRVLPDLEPLGEWLERHGMPVTKGPARRYRPRKQTGGSTAGGGGGGGSQPALSNEAGGEASGGGGPGGGEMEVAAPPAAKNRGGAGEVCSSTCGGGAGAGVAQRQQQQQLQAVGSSAFALQQHLQQQYLQQQLLLLSGAQGAAAAAAAARLQQAGEASLGISQGIKLELGDGGGGPARMDPAAAAAVAAGAPSEDEAEGTAALMSLSMQGASGPAAAAPRPPRGGGGGAAAAATGAGTHSPPPPQRRQQQQPKTARYHRGGGGGTTPEYGGEGEEGDAEGLDRAAADAEVGGGGGGGGDAGAHRRLNGVPRNGSTAAARGGGGGGGPAPGDGSSSRAAAPPSRSEGALGSKDLGAAMAADAAAARAEASALAAAAPPAPHVTLNGASATRRGALVGKLDPEDGSEAMEHVDRGDPRFAQAASGYGADDDVHGDADAYGNYPVPAATMRQRAAAAVRGMPSSDAVWAGGPASGRANGGGGARPLGVGQEIGLPLGQAGYVAAGFPGGAAAVTRSGLRGLPPPHLTHVAAQGRGRGVSVDAAGGAGAWFGGDGGGVDAASGGGEYGDEDFDAEDEQLQTHLMSVGAPALLLTIQLEQMELYDRMRRLERLRRRLEALQQQQQQQQRIGLPKMEAAAGRRGGPPPGYDALLQHSAAAAAVAALDERIGGGGGRGVGVKRPRGDGGGVLGGGGGGLRMMDEDMYGGGHGADHGMHDSGDAGVSARSGLDVSRLAEMYAAAAAAATSDAGVHLGRGQAPPQPPLVRLVHRGPQPGARGGGGDARELALAAEDDEAYGMYGSEVLAPPHAVHRQQQQQQQQQQQAWGRVPPRAEAAALQGWGRSHPAGGGGGGGNGGGNGGPHHDELRVAAAAAHYAMQLGGAARGGGGGGRRQRGDEHGIGGGGPAAPRGVDDDWD